MGELKEATNIILKCLTGLILVEAATRKEIDLFEQFEKENEQ